MTFRSVMVTVSSGSVGVGVEQPARASAPMAATAANARIRMVLLVELSSGCGIATGGAEHAR
jgi:hypothetical protein